jgi:acyl carrier protein
VTENTAPDATTVEAYRAWIHDWMAREMGIDRSLIDPDQTFLSYGMDSVQAMTMVGDLEAKTGKRLPPTLAWDYPDINALAAHLAACSREMPSGQARPAGSAGKLDSLLPEIDIREREAHAPLNPYVEGAQKPT